jgi:hypothetical protein
MYFIYTIMILHQMGHFQLNKRENDQVAKLGNTVIFNFICCEFCLCGLVVLFCDILPRLTSNHITVMLIYALFH